MRYPIHEFGEHSLDPKEFPRFEATLFLERRSTKVIILIFPFSTTLILIFLSWWSLLDGTRWLQHMSGLMRAAATLAAAVERDARPVLVHCSDGWDRTPQIVALAELLLDPYYRTIEVRCLPHFIIQHLPTTGFFFSQGFRVLVEREWLAFGHKFADRCGQSGSDDLNERCPVFLQWLDCIHQLQLQFPCSFEFAGSYLVKLAQHTYSNLFGTFLCNTKQERVEHVNDRTFSVWRYLNTNNFRNHLYTQNGQVSFSYCVLSFLIPS